jgi:4-hydroxy-tetrahydrodipicolinate reductase
VTEPRLSAVLYGGGRLCENVARILEGRPSVELLGVFRRDGRERALRLGADVVLVATTSFLSAVADDIRLAVESGSNVITSAEEAAFPWAVDETLADELDGLARERGVTILGGGLNPGFSFDALVLTACGATWDVESIRVGRVVWLGGFSASILRRLGIGYSADEFAAGAATGAISGHIGFPQSMRIVAQKLGVRIERIERQIVPTLTPSPIELESMPVAAGTSGGFEQHYTAFVDGSPWFEALFTGHVDLAAIGASPRDEIRIVGASPVHLVLDPGLGSQAGSAAVVANSLRRVAAAPPGWLTVADLPPAVPL